MKFRLLATDIDGTITDEKGRIHLKAMTAIRDLEERGIPVVLVSGRPLPFVESLALFTGTSGPVIAENGAVVKLGGTISQMGDPQAAREALAFLKTKFPLELDDDNRYRMVDVSIQMTMDPDRIR
ncbi:MAG TPA: HAD-IIB family hydrolase, partial [Bacillota bacterium]|nr:HAD-IIB family hydrolase [Bacillota bacterium]